jgi:hypothetical protein
LEITPVTIKLHLLQLRNNTSIMVKDREKRVIITRQLKNEGAMGCLVRVLQGILPFGSVTALAQSFGVDQKTIGKQWYSTLKLFYA